jgi:hypothetical protein
MTVPPDDQEPEQAEPEDLTGVGYVEDLTDVRGTEDLTDAEDLTDGDYGTDGEDLTDAEDLTDGDYGTDAEDLTDGDYGTDAEYLDEVDDEDGQTPQIDAWSAQANDLWEPGQEEQFAIWRIPVLVIVVVALVGAGLVAWAVGVPASGPPPPPAALAAAAAPADAQSSSWYCTGGTGTAGSAANATLYLVNASAHPVSGTVTVVSGPGQSTTAPVTVGADSETTVVPESIRQGTWLASDVDLDGGGVAVSEVVDGPLGWSEAPCASVTSAQWYFASGSTVNGSTLFVSVFNPMSTPAVVDLSFLTPSGQLQPQPFEGLVLAPRALVVAEVASYVQDQSSVSTVVEARSGRVVAAELEERSVGPTVGLSLRLGSPAPAARWTLPRSVNVTGGRTSIVVFNPGTATERVSVRVRLPAGPVAPFVTKLAPDSTWTLVTSSSDRIPPNTDYSTSVVATGGSGVVVDRVTRSSSAGSVPQWGATTAVSGSVSGVKSAQWVVMGPSYPAPPPEANAAPFALALANPGTAPVSVTVVRLASGKSVPLAQVPTLRLLPGTFAVIEPSRLSGTGADPLLVKATGSVAVLEDATPAGMPGVVTLAAVPTGR